MFDRDKSSKYNSVKDKQLERLVRGEKEKIRSPLELNMRRKCQRTFK